MRAGRSRCSQKGSGGVALGRIHRVILLREDLLGKVERGWANEGQVWGRGAYHPALQEIGSWLQRT